MFERLEKYIILMMVIIAMAALGSTINRRNTADDKRFIENTDKPDYIGVTVCGEVKNPGEYRVKEGMRVCDVIYAAGGITTGANVKSVDLDAIVTDKMTVEVCGINEEAVADAIPVININTADADALCLIPGIGETISQKIVDYRKQYGRFSDISEIMCVDGIGEKTFNKIKDYIKTEETQK